MSLNVDALKQALDTRPDFGWRAHFVELGLNIGFNTTSEEAAEFGLAKTKEHLSGYFYVADREKFMDALRNVHGTDEVLRVLMELEQA